MVLRRRQNEEQKEYLTILEKSIFLLNQMQYTTELALPNVNIDSVPVDLSELLGVSIEISNSKSGGACVKFWHAYH